MQNIVGISDINVRDRDALDQATLIFRHRDSNLWPRNLWRIVIRHNIDRSRRIYRIRGAVRYLVAELDFTIEVRSRRKLPVRLRSIYCNLIASHITRRVRAIIRNRIGIVRGLAAGTKDRIMTSLH